MLTNALQVQFTVLLTYYKNTFRQGVSNDGDSHVETSSICAVPLGVAKMCMLGSQVQPLLMYSKNTFHQGVCNDGGSHVEMSSICVVPLGIVKTSGVIYYICSPLDQALYGVPFGTCTWGSQAQPL